MSNFLGISNNCFINVMLKLDLFYFYGKGDKRQVRIRKDKIINWGENNNISLEYDFYKPHGGTKMHYIRLGQFNTKKFSCKQQIQNKTKPYFYKTPNEKTPNVNVEKTRNVNVAFEKTFEPSNEKVSSE